MWDLKSLSDKEVDNSIHSSPNIKVRVKYVFGPYKYINFSF